MKANFLSKGVTMKRSGFSMIELVFVIVILGVLAAVAVPRFVATRTDAQVATARSDLATIQKQVVAKIFADNIDPTTSNAPNPNRKVADQGGQFSTPWAEWMLLISGVSRDKFRPLNSGNWQPNTGWGQDRTINQNRVIEPLGNVSTNQASGKGRCGGILGISESGRMIFDPTKLEGRTLSAGNNAGSEKQGSFCHSLRLSYVSSNDYGNRITPLSTAGTIEW